MTSDTLKLEIEKAIPMVIKLAKEITWNKYSDNYKFILSEIKNSDENLLKRLKARRIKNDLKTAISLDELVAHLQQIYDNLYDINLYVYKAMREISIIEIQYYPKSSLEESYRSSVMNNPPMLHCKVSHPPWYLSENKNKFDINWEHFDGMNKWRLKKLIYKLRFQNFLHRMGFKRLW